MKNTFEDSVSDQEFHSALMEAFESSEGGIQKNASAVSTKVVRRRIRESSFFRLVLPWEKITDDRLTPQLNSELPAVLCHMEPSSRGAKSFPFGDSTDTVLYRGDKFLVIFCKVGTDWYTKDVNELRTYGYDLRKIVIDNALRDVHTEEDSRGMTLVNRIIGSPGSVGEAGVQQNFETAGGINRSSYRRALSDLEDRYLNNGVFLMNRNTAKAFLDFDYSEVGALAQSSFQEGVKGLVKNGGQLELFGVPHISTIKSNIIPNGSVYQFAEAEFLGKAMMLEDLRMYVEKKVDILRFCAWEIVGMTLSNVAAVNKRSYNAAI